MSILGLHHVTAISGDAQETVDFYAGVLGLRMVKKTVNFDDPGTYHLYFGNAAGEPGSVMTFFPWSNRGLKGRVGTGQVSVTSFAIPEKSISFWLERLKKHDVAVSGSEDRFEEEVIHLQDPDGLQLELVATSKDTRIPWSKGPVPEKFAIGGFYHVALAVEGYERTAGLLTETLGFRQVAETGNRFRYQVGDGGAGALVDVLCLPDETPGVMGVGAVHHVAWRTPDESTQLQMRTKVAELGYNVTPVLDRNYFRSIYFREPGHILFEIATDPPGFMIDEEEATLGQNLKLPPWLEERRSEIERVLPPLQDPETK